MLPAILDPHATVDAAPIMLLKSSVVDVEATEVVVELISITWVVDVDAEGVVGVAGVVELVPQFTLSVNAPLLELKPSTKII